VRLLITKRSMLTFGLRARDISLFSLDFRVITLIQFQKFKKLIGVRVAHRTGGSGNNPRRRRNQPIAPSLPEGAAGRPGGPQGRRAARISPRKGREHLRVGTVLGDWDDVAVGRGELGTWRCWEACRGDDDGRSRRLAARVVGSEARAARSGSP
jgi:hypothetical protein